MTDIARLFAEDPENLTRDDISTIVAKYREALAQFALGVAQAGSAKKVAPKGPKITNLDDLDLDL